MMTADRFRRTSMTSSPETVVLIPARNEEATVAEVVRNAKAVLHCETVVIDDASTDDTIGVARAAGATVLPLAVQLGAWGAMQTGLRYALNNGFSSAVTMDADGQHAAAGMLRLLEPLDAGCADVVIGACVERCSSARCAAWSFFRCLSGIGIRDLTSGFRAYNLAAMQRLVSRRASLLDYQDLGVLILLEKCGLRTLEIEVEMGPRTVGSSKIFNSWWVVGKYMLLNTVLCVAKRKLSGSLPMPAVLSDQDKGFLKGIWERLA